VPTPVSTAQAVSLLQAVKFKPTLPPTRSSSQHPSLNTDNCAQSLTSLTRAVRKYL